MVFRGSGAPASRGDSGHVVQHGSPTLHEARAAGFFVSRSAANFSGALVAIVCMGYGALSFVGILQNLGMIDAAFSAVYTLGILGFQLGYFSRPRGRLTSGRSAAALLVLAALVYLPALQFGTYWLSFLGFLGGSLLIALPPKTGVAAYLLVVAQSGFQERRFGADELEPVFSTAYTVSATAITGLVIFGLTRLARLVRELHDAQDELSRMAVAEERLRFASDAHDLLGMSLSTLTLKAELAHRVVQTEPDRARSELAEMLAVSRRALGEVRMVASGTVSLSLSEELVSARSVLTAADIETSIRGERVELPDEVATLCATLLREAVTNILRHSKADVCQISVSVTDGTARIAVMNDRAGEGSVVPDDRHGAGHRGISSLRQRFVDQHGELTVHSGDGEFTIVGTLAVLDGSTP